jgi:hypothetical protein
MGTPLIQVESPQQWPLRTLFHWRFEEAVMSKGQPSDGARGNRLLGAMESASLARIAPNLEPVVLKLGEVVCEAGGVLKHAYFPQGAVLSLLTVLENGSAIETANIGREGALAEDYVHENVANLSADTRSALNLYHALIELRKATPELVVGSYAPVATTADLLAYRREYEDNALLIVLNLGADPISIGSDTMAFPGEILLSTNLDRIGETVSGGLDLCGDEGLIIRLQ